MPNCDLTAHKMRRITQSRSVFLLLLAVFLSGCGQPPAGAPAAGPTSLKEVPAVRLNYRYEPDVPAPGDGRRTPSEERNAAVQRHFDQSRLNELLDKTIARRTARYLAVRICRRMYSELLDIIAGRAAASQGRHTRWR